MKRGLAFLFLALLLVALAPAGVWCAPEESPERPKLLFLPYIGVAQDYSGFIVNRGDASSLWRRECNVDLFQYGRHIIHLEFRDDTSLGVPQDRWDPNRLYYRMQTPGYRYDLGDHYLGVNVDHWCLNNYRTEKFHGNSTGRPQVSVYLLALEFMTKSMRLGMKDQGIDFDGPRAFEWLGRWHYRASLGKTFDNFPATLHLTWEAKLQARWDLFRYRRLVAYLEGGAEVWQGQGWLFFPYGEVGVRLHLGDRVYLIPYLSGGRRPELFEHPRRENLINIQGQKFLSGGLRLEAALSPRGAAGPPREDDWQFLPEIHGNAGYAWLMHSCCYGFTGGIELDLEVLRRGPWTLFLYNGFFVDTGRSDLTVVKGRYWLQYGLTYTREPFFGEAFVDHGMRLDGKNWNRISERSHNAGLRLGTQGMKPGYFNYGITFDESGFHWLNRLNAQVSAGHFFQNRDWQYLWNLSAQGRWDLCRYSMFVPYVAGEVTWLNGGGASPDAVNYAGEAGVRIHGYFDMNIYYRFQHQENGRYFRGPPDNRSLIGVKALF